MNTNAVFIRSISNIPFMMIYVNPVVDKRLSYQSLSHFTSDDHSKNDYLWPTTVITDDDMI